jgi:hypothetical protein
VTAYKKKISEKGKTELIHIRFDKNNNENINTSCPIMQTDFEDEQYVIKLPCNHMFTPEAINKWLEEKPECPVCRFELDSIEVKRENNSHRPLQNNSLYLLNRTPIFFRTNISNQPSPIRQPNNTSYFPTRQFGSDRTELNNSHLDYLYEEMDNADFQRAIMLSYREMINNSNQVITSSIGGCVTDDDIETNTISNTQLRNNVDNRNDIEDDEIYNQSYSDMNETLTGFIIDNYPDYNNDNVHSSTEITNCSDDDTERDTIENYTEDDDTCDDVLIVSIDSED